jgi:putative addiction module component (TIGR02574 family)
MTVRAKELLEEELSLPADERAVLAEGLLTSLDRPDARIDELWARETEERAFAHDAGQMAAYPAEDVLA